MDALGIKYWLNHFGKRNELTLWSLASNQNISTTISIQTAFTMLNVTVLEIFKGLTTALPTVK